MGLDVETIEPGVAVGTMQVTEKHFSKAQRMHGGLVFVVYSIARSKDPTTILVENNPGSGNRSWLWLWLWPLWASAV